MTHTHRTLQHDDTFSLDRFMNDSTITRLIYILRNDPSCPHLHELEDPGTTPLLTRLLRNLSGGVTDERTLELYRKLLTVLQDLNVVSTVLPVEGLTRQRLCCMCHATYCEKDNSRGLCQPKHTVVTKPYEDFIERINSVYGEDWMDYPHVQATNVTMMYRHKFVHYCELCCWIKPEDKDSNNWVIHIGRHTTGTGTSSASLDQEQRELRALLARHFPPPPPVIPITTTSTATTANGNTTNSDYYDDGVETEPSLSQEQEMQTGATHSWGLNTVNSDEDRNRRYPDMFYTTTTNTNTTSAQQQQHQQYLSQDSAISNNEQDFEVDDDEIDDKSMIDAEEYWVATKIYTCFEEEEEEEGEEEIELGSSQASQGSTS